MVDINANVIRAPCSLSTLITMCERLSESQVRLSYHHQENKYQTGWAERCFVYIILNIELNIFKHPEIQNIFLYLHRITPPIYSYPHTLNIHLNPIMAIFKQLLLFPIISIFFR